MTDAEIEVVALNVHLGVNKLIDASKKEKLPTLNFDFHTRIGWVSR